MWFSQGQRKAAALQRQPQRQKGATAPEEDHNFACDFLVVGRIVSGCGGLDFGLF